MRWAVVIAVFAMFSGACKGGSDKAVTMEKTSFDSGLSPVPGDLPDQAPPDRVGDVWTIYGLWRATREPSLLEQVLDADIKVQGHVVSVTVASEDPRQANITPHIWIAREPNRKGISFPVTGYAPNYGAMRHAAAYDACLAACTRAKGDPRPEADRQPERYSRIFGNCLADVDECRSLYEGDRRARFFELIGNLFKWYVRDHVFGSNRRKQIEDDLRANGNIICEAGPAQRRILVTTMVAGILGFDLDAYKRQVLEEIRVNYGGQRPEQLDPSILQNLSNAKLTVLDDAENNRRLWEAIRAMRAGTNDGADLLAVRGLGAELRAAITKGGEGSDIKKVADDLLFDMLIRWFYSKSDTKDSANKACVFDDLLDLTSSYFDPLDLISREQVMLGPQADMTWEQARDAAPLLEFRGKFVSRSRTGFIGFTIDISTETICGIPGNCPRAINPILGNVYDFGFAEE
jgi:hypothetical protein